MSDHEPSQSSRADDGTVEEPPDSTVDGWVSLTEAAERTGADEPWLLERCREGTLPSRPAPDEGVLVPLATAEALASRTITE